MSLMKRIFFLSFAGPISTLNTEPNFFGFTSNLSQSLVSFGMTKFESGKCQFEPKLVIAKRWLMTHFCSEYSRIARTAHFFFIKRLNIYRVAKELRLKTKQNRIHIIVDDASLLLLIFRAHGLVGRYGASWWLQRGRQLYSKCVHGGSASCPLSTREKRDVLSGFLKCRSWCHNGYKQNAAIVDQWPQRTCNTTFSVKAQTLAAIVILCCSRVMSEK